MRKKLIAGNWKMNKTLSDSKLLIQEIKEGVNKIKLHNVEVVICPPFTSLPLASELLKGSVVKVGAQNVFHKDFGAYTGEISAPMLKDSGCEYVIIGHSERRQYFNETNHLINLKVKNVLQNNLKVILCVGETLGERESNLHIKVVDEQVTLGLKEINQEAMRNVIIAYEPVWAIGTGKTATPEQAEEMHKEIRTSLSNLYGDEIANQTLILYGGSVNETNSYNLFKMPNIDGGLIGGASLKAESFLKIIQSIIN
ncbi:MAG: triose-phosphate isomerase [Ignavibacteria bacterium]